MSLSAILGGGVLLLIAALIYVSKRWGAAGAGRDSAEEGNDHAKKANAIDERVRDLSPAQREQLLNRRD